ncbi:hypothetical protein RHGRI_032286 [Rhododendron griersonianum]|uniref:Uncharacterized protein n=1 Tax=Rhododendron griersonianum TaxID=479676 RepID=A0AAV6IES3_9ERIC|nr:hypothetical protein RHGRI_032286 [Rhododendron griersonianum]
MVMMKKKIMVLSLVLLFIISLSHMEGVESQGVNSRLYLRCDRKCQIKCNPGLEVEAHLR